MELRLPRVVHRGYAGLTGRFWSPCPSCSRMFGGHEWKPDASETGEGHIADVVVDGEHRAICPRCTALGVGCRSNAAHQRVHLQCPYVTGAVLLEDE